MREETQLRVIKEVLESFSGKELFGKHLKRFLHRNRQLGSRDRRLIQQFSYNYFRIGAAMNGYPMEEKLAVANYLCCAEVSPLLEYLLKKNTKLDASTVSNSLNEKMSIINHQSSIINHQSIFPFLSHLSEQIDEKPFTESFLHQPLLWIRVRKKFLEATKKELAERNISFSEDESNHHCFKLKNATSLDTLESYKNGYFEIQDRSSQQTMAFIQPKEGQYWWDACCASGGKSLMTLDSEPSLCIYATDIRETVIQNLRERFSKAGMKKYRVEKIDLTQLPENFILPDGFKPDGIIADVPCSGSGTWARTPEWLTMFREIEIGKFVALQQKIVSTLVKYLPPGKPLVYITCSVFKEENEDNIRIFTQELPLTLENSGYLKGFAGGSDTMFAARLTRKQL